MRGVADLEDSAQPTTASRAVLLDAARIAFYAFGDCKFYSDHSFAGAEGEKLRLRITHLDVEMNWMYLNYLRRPMPSRRGAVTPLTVLNLSLLVGTVALAVDGGTLLETRRHVQAAADAAALAGAADLYSNYLTNQGIDVNGTAKASALATASANGFLNDGVQSSVTINTSPQTYQSGPNTGKTIPAGYIEVVIQYNASRLFSGIFGSGSLPVRARAVARGRCTAISNNALIALSLKASGSLTVSSAGGLNVNGGIQINSSSASAVQLIGGGTVTTTQLTLNPSSGGLLSLISSLLSGPGGTTSSAAFAAPAADPLRYLSPPDAVQLGLSTQGTNLRIITGTVDLYPGVYSGGIRIDDEATVTLHANSDGTPGIYYLQGLNGLQLSGAASLTTAANETAGVLIYNDWSSATAVISLGSSGTVSLTPPASGPYRGLSIFQNRGTYSSSGPNVSLGGTGNVQVPGTIYAAYANVALIGTTNTNVLGGQIIADTVSIGGSATVTIGSDTQGTSANQRILGLVE